MKRQSNHNKANLQSDDAGDRHLPVNIHHNALDPRCRDYFFQLWTRQQLRWHQRCGFLSPVYGLPILHGTVILIFSAYITAQFGVASDCLPALSHKTYNIWMALAIQTFLCGIKDLMKFDINMFLPRYYTGDTSLVGGAKMQIPFKLVRASVEHSCNVRSRPFSWRTMNLAFLKIDCQTPPIQWWQIQHHLGLESLWKQSSL